MRDNRYEDDYDRGHRDALNEVKKVDTSKLAEELGLSESQITPEIHAAMAVIGAQYRKLVEDIVAAASRPAEPEVGRTVRFSKRFASGDTLYTFVAYHSPVGWHVTGRHTQKGYPWTWAQLLRFAGENPIQVDMEWRTL